MTLVAVVVLVVAITTLFTLFVRAKDIPPPEPVSPTQYLEDRKAAIYENLRDLQFEYRVGKLSDADYQQTKLTLQKELAGVLANIDRVTQQNPGAAKAQRAAAAKAPRSTAPRSKSEAEPVDATPVEEKPVDTPAGEEPADQPAPAVASVCPHCGAEFPTPMKFCGECGKAMG